MAIQQLDPILLETLDQHPKATVSPEKDTLFERLRIPLVLACVFASAFLAWLAPRSSSSGQSAVNKAIEDIRVGDYVLAQDPASGETMPKRVIEV